jgi:hypothetical protein
MGSSPGRIAPLGHAELKIRHGYAKRGRRRTVVCRPSDVRLEWVCEGFASGYRGTRHRRLARPQVSLVYVERLRACKVRARDRVSTPPTDPAGDIIQEDASTDKYAQVPSLLESHPPARLKGTMPNRALGGVSHFHVQRGGYAHQWSYALPRIYRLLGAIYPPGSLSTPPQCPHLRSRTWQLIRYQSSDPTPSLGKSFSISAMAQWPFPPRPGGKRKTKDKSPSFAPRTTARPV